MLLLAIVAPGVSVVFGLLGATCCVVMCYFVPIFGYLEVYKEELSLCKRRALQVAFALIVCVGVTSVVISIYDIVKKED